MSEKNEKFSVLASEIRSTEITVGDEVLCLREPSIKATHKILDIVFDDALVSGVSGLTTLFADKDEDVGMGTWALQNLSVVVKVLQDAVAPLVSRKAGDIAAIVLNTKENRKRLKMDGNELMDWVKDEISTTQTMLLIKGLKDLIDWDELVKHFRALLPSLPDQGETVVPEEKTAS